MVSNYASLQLGLPGREKEGDFSAVQEEAVRSRVTDAVVAYMEGLGYISCAKEGAERIICLVHTMKGWTLFDDCADRLNIAALDGLGRGLTRRLHTRGVGVMCSGDGMLFRLYAEGKLKDAYLSAKGKKAFGRVGGGCFWWFRCRGHALRWRAQLAPTYTVKELADVFARGEQGGRAYFSQLRLMLNLDETADFGFASVEAAGLQGVVTLYFQQSNLVRQRLGQKSIQAIRRAASGLGTLIKKPSQSTAEPPGK